MRYLLSLVILFSFGGAKAASSFKKLKPLKHGSYKVKMVTQFGEGPSETTELALCYKGEDLGQLLDYQCKTEIVLDTPADATARATCTVDGEKFESVMIFRWVGNQYFAETKGGVGKNSIYTRSEYNYLGSCK